MTRSGSVGPVSTIQGRQTYWIRNPNPVSTVEEPIDDSADEVVHPEQGLSVVLAVQTDACSRHFTGLAAVFQ